LADIYVNHITNENGEILALVEENDAF